MRFIERVGIVILACGAVFFLGLTALYMSGVATPRLSPRLLPVAALEPTATPAPTATPDCRQEILQYGRTTLAPIMLEWDDAVNLARSSPRMSLASPVATLQAIRRKLVDVEQSPCTTSIHSQFLAATEETIEGFLAFLSRESDEKVQQHFVKAEGLLIRVNTLLDDANSLK